MTPAVLVIQLDHVHLLARDLGRALRSGQASPATVGQLAGLLLLAAGRVYDELQDGALGPLAAESLGAIVRRSAR